MGIQRRSLVLLVLGACAFWGWQSLDFATGEVAVLRTRGHGHVERYATVWFVRANRALWIRAENREQRWLAEIAANPRVELAIAGHTRAYEAHPVDLPNYQAYIDAEFRKKYGVADWVRSLREDRDSVPIRLDPI